MAPSQRPVRLQVRGSSSTSMNALVQTNSSNISSSSTTDLTLPSPGSHRALFTDTFVRPRSANSLPAKQFRKNMKDITGFATTEEEFEALPLAIRRKYFSTLERLRFAQNSRTNAFDELPIQTHRKSSIADRRGINSPPVIEPRKKSSGRRIRKLSRPSISDNEASWFLTLPDKIKKREFTREEQVILAGRLRESVILDAADEAIYKASRRASRNLMPLLDQPDSRSNAGRESSPRSEDSTSSMTAVMYETFRWMDDEEDLNLKLVLDDYHANLDGVVIPTPNSQRKPSFRRQMSISKMPFGRNSLSSISSRSPRHEPGQPHNRSKSRTISLMAPRHVGHTATESISSIDPNATHYQDPEARLKLRVYLASPQKFDEAIEFGFPSVNGVADGDKENKPVKRLSRDAIVLKKSFATEKSFLNDDDVSLFEDDVSMVDPESPLTPLAPETVYQCPNQGSEAQSLEETYKPSMDLSHHGASKLTTLNRPESYTQALAGAREMTLRMTLTRPDLRADDSTIYGWQSGKSPLREEKPMALDVEEKYDVKGPLGGADGWGLEKDDSVVKRFWKKVKSSQRKPS